MKITKNILHVLLLSCLFFTTMGMTGCSGFKSISVDTEEAFLVFEVGKEFNTTGIKITGKQDNGQSIELSADECKISRPDISTVGEKTVTVTHKRKPVSYKINVVARKVTAIFKGDIYLTNAIGPTYLVLSADFICYNTLDWELWYIPDGINAQAAAVQQYAIRETGRYRLSNGVYSMYLLSGLEVTESAGGEVTFRYGGYLPAVMDAQLVATTSGIFIGKLTLITTLY